MPELLIPDSWGSLAEVNTCHGPGRGHPCTGAGAHLYTEYTKTDLDKQYVDERAHLEGRAKEAAELLKPHLPGMKVWATSQGALHQVHIAAGSVGTSLVFSIARPDQPWDRIAVTGVWGGVHTTFRWKPGQRLNAKRIAKVVQEVIEGKRQRFDEMGRARPTGG